MGQRAEADMAGTRGVRMPRPAHTWLGPVLALAALAILLWAGMTGAARAQDEVQVGVFVTSISAINPSDGSFRMAGYLWFIDPTGTFDPEQDVEFIARSATYSTFAHRTLADGRVYTALSFDAVVDHPFNVRDYPFDAQSLSLSIESAQSTAARILVPDLAGSSIADFVRAPGWRIRSLSLDVSQESHNTDFGYWTETPFFSRIEVRVGIKRNISPFLFEKFTGFFVAFIITALVLLVPVEDLGTRVGMTTGSVFAAVFNRYRMEDAIGFDAVFGVADQVSLLTFSVILQILVLSLICYNLRRTWGDGAVTRISRRVGAGVVGIHVVLTALAFSFALT